jgi:hypothetical protein
LALASGKGVRELAALSKRELVQVVLAQRLRVAGLGTALKATRGEAKQYREELTYLHDVAGRAGGMGATPTAMHVVARGPPGALTRARVRERELLDELRRLRVENRDLHKSKGSATTRERLISELQEARLKLMMDLQKLRRVNEEQGAEIRNYQQENRAQRAECARLRDRNQGLVSRIKEMGETLGKTTEEMGELRTHLDEAQDTVDFYQWNQEATASRGNQERMEMEKLSLRVRTLAAHAERVEAANQRLQKDNLRLRRAWGTEAEMPNPLDTEEEEAAVQLDEGVVEAEAEAEDGVKRSDEGEDGSGGGDRHHYGKRSGPRSSTPPEGRWSTVSLYAPKGMPQPRSPMKLPVGSVYDGNGSGRGRPPRVRTRAMKRVSAALRDVGDSYFSRVGVSREGSVEAAERQRFTAGVGSEADDVYAFEDDDSDEDSYSWLVAGNEDDDDEEEEDLRSL